MIIGIIFHFYNSMVQLPSYRIILYRNIYALIRFIRMIYPSQEVIFQKFNLISKFLNIYKFNKCLMSLCIKRCGSQRKEIEKVCY